MGMIRNIKKNHQHKGIKLDQKNIDALEINQIIADSTW